MTTHPIQREQAPGTVAESANEREAGVQKKGEPLVRLRNVSKRYPGTLALDDVSYAVYPGSVNVLIGENGAGKSTLMKILAGAERPSDGEILVGDQAVSFGGVRDAEKAGIGIIFQELNLFPDLTITENLFIGSEKRRFGLIDVGSQQHDAKQLLERVGLHLNPATRLGDLHVGQQQLVEIARVLGRNVRVLIMDEPTSALSQTEVEVLFSIIENLRREGVAIIYISHRLEEIMRIGDHITVLRNGRVVGVDQVARIDIPWIVQQMVGDEKKAFDYSPRETGEMLLAVRNLWLRRSNGTLALDNISFSAGRGEIIGIYGLMGAGRTELMEVLLGLHGSARGDIELDGKSLAHGQPARHIGAGIALVPEDRQSHGMFQPLSVRDNMTLSSLRRYCGGLPGLNLIMSRREQHHSRRMIESLGIKTADDTLPITSLSGGNMQKVVIARALLTQPRILLFDEPTRGVDVGAKADIYRAMSDIAAQGVTILYTTSELDEALAVSDRVLVMAAGRITADLRREEADRNHIMQKSAPTVVSDEDGSTQGVSQ
ncbi:MAG: sugar ABC transporter ATP-binding protein [Salinicola sp.]|uniref:sugar ABC transporter ATP-binding protein n=1 Tax=Salinicola sp. TaxID=1978524 RepID=UPI001DCAEAAE|nr:sugar ABC transporter ATP-binding protein [Salinicola sp.]NRB55538.1 sugar ABC transporter ATP-binding protein [Salinicola sp.]